MARLGDIGNSAGINVLPYLLLLCNRCCCLMRGIVLLQACPFFVGLSSSRRARSFMSRSRRASGRSNFASILRIRKSMRHIFQKCTWVDHGSYSNSHSRVMRINYCNQAICRAPAWQGSQRSRTADRCFLDSARNQAYIYIYEELTRLDSFWLLSELFPELACHPRSPRLHAFAGVIESPCA